jgi:AcrR family transcriptional regulator
MEAEVAAEQRRRGRPRHEPTDQTRALVARMVGEDATVDAIAAAVQVSEPTLRLHYAQELASERPQKKFPFAADRRVAPRVGAGRPEHVPSAEQREMVEVLAATRWPQWRIAQAVGVSEPVLRACYADELETGGARREAALMMAAYRAAAEGNVSAMKAFLGTSRALDEPPAPEPMGKKAMAAVKAQTAGTRGQWAGLLPH